MPGRKGQRSGGHNRKTAEEHAAQGTTQRCRESGYASTEPQDGRPTKPAELDEYGRQLWQAVDMLDGNRVGAIDTTAIAEMCRWYSLYRKLQKLWEDDPCDKEARLGCTAAFDRFKRIFDCYPFDPISRSRLDVPSAAEEDKTTDMLGQLQQMRGEVEG